MLIVPLLAISFLFAGFIASTLVSQLALFIAAGIEGTVTTNPIGAVPKRSKCPIDGGRAFSLMFLQVLEKPGRHRTCPVVGMAVLNKFAVSLARGLHCRCVPVLRQVGLKCDNWRRWARSRGRLQKNRHCTKR